MERRHVKRLPVTRAGRVVGIISRSNLMHALASFARETGESAPTNDSQIRANIQAVLDRETWAPRVSVVVKNGVAELWGVITDDRERKAVVVAVENVPGVEHVHDHLVWVEPMSGMAFPSAEDEAKTGSAIY
jgi:osmotically-inducible protein OsmY